MLPVFGLYHVCTNPNPCPLPSPYLYVLLCCSFLGFLGLPGLVSSVWVVHSCTARGPCLIVGIAPVIWLRNYRRRRCRRLLQPWSALLDLYRTLLPAGFCLIEVA